jgi:threonine aldolase
MLCHWLYPFAISIISALSLEECFMNCIDLRRDTITLPDAAMIEKAFNAPLGDSVYGEDPKQEELEAYAAELLGKDGSLFVPSGTMGNLAALLSHTRRGDEIIMEEQGHIRTSETGGAACVGGLMIRGVKGDDGAPDPQLLEQAIRPDNIHYPRSSLICLESTHYRYGGIVPPLKKFKAIRAIADRHGIPIHLDGARVFNAAAYLQVDVQNITRYADSVMVSLSKGLGAPVGSMLAGSKEFIRNARRYRKMLGGGMRQTGWLCACGIVALSPENRARLKIDHENALLLARGLCRLPGLDIDLHRTQTNYVVARLQTDVMTAPLFVTHLRERGVLASASGDRVVRFVVSKQVSRDNIEEALNHAVEIWEEHGA